ncbi:MAG: type II toxin-antitoxin system VapC family toxin [Thermodesulfobacteriota bacterium]
MNSILVDTNVLIYATDEDSTFFEPAQSLISRSDLDLYTTSKNLTEFLSVVTRHPRNRISVSDAITVIDDFYDIFQILYPTKKSYGILLTLLNQYRPAGLKIHDFEIAGIGLANGIKHIATFNEKDFNTIAEVEMLPLS